LNPSLFPVHPRLSPQGVETYRALAVTDGSVVDAISAEMESVAESMAQVRAARITTLGNIPLIVLSHGVVEAPPAGLGIPPEALRQQEEVWQAMQVELATLSANGKRVVAEQSGHYIQLEQHELVVAAIREVTEMWAASTGGRERRGRP
jgi:pimeloyl-ACP methyl ester carboxylesterase